MAGRAVSSGGHTGEATLAEPHELHNAERTFLKLLELTRRGVLPAKFLPAVSDLQTALAEDPCSRCHLLSLSHDELGVIFAGLADPLQPKLAVVFSSTCKGLRNPLRAALEELEGQHQDAKELCYHVPPYYDAESETRLPMSWRLLRYQTDLKWNNLNVDAPVEAMSTLGMIMRTNGLSKLQVLDIVSNQFGDAGAQELFEGLGPGSLPKLQVLDISCNNIGPAGAEAFASALRRGAMPKLALLGLNGNPIGNQGVAGLAAPLRKLRKFMTLGIHACEIGDEGMTSLLGNLGKDDFKTLKDIGLGENNLTVTGCATLLAAIKAGALPCLEQVLFEEGNPFSADVVAALAARKQ
tara:strand:+ start:59 stop:1117 length:1059 start_codon:yes stop_codon:yes gene_type:complete